MEDMQILRQNRRLFWKITLAQLVVGTATFFAASVLLDWLRFEHYLRFWVVRPFLQLIGAG